MSGLANNRTEPDIGRGQLYAYSSIAIHRPRELRIQKEGEMKGFQPLRVLVVDDNRDVADSLMMMVKIEGHEVFVAYDTAVGLRLAAEVVPDLIFHDIGLPNMSGYEAARRLRQDQRLQKTLLIAYTGYGTDLDQKQAKEAGFDRYVVKPMEHETLVSLLGAAAAAR
jgi:CheY-like chemotaxis protein